MTDQVNPPVSRHQPVRGDDVEAWLKRHRNLYVPDSPAWSALDAALDHYREKADYGLRLDEDGGDP